MSGCKIAQALDVLDSDLLAADLDDVCRHQGVQFPRQGLPMGGDAAGDFVMRRSRFDRTGTVDDLRALAKTQLFVDQALSDGQGAEFMHPLGEASGLGDQQFGNSQPEMRVFGDQ